jgi:uncharacterized membrane protein YfcA
MLYLEHSILLFLIFFQSIFGIGLLIFGTPTFLILGYNFEQTLSILLPISLSVSACQFFMSKENIRVFLFDTLKFCILPLIFFLYLSLIFIDEYFLKLTLSFLMIMISICKILNMVEASDKLLSKNHSTILFVIGCIHGLSNLGGGFLSLYASSLFKKNYLRARKAIAFGYFLFASVQIITIFFFKSFYFYKNFFYFIFLVPFIFLITDFLLKNLNFKFEKIINYVVLLYGVILLVITIYLK